jgi:hypothetical protein
VAELLVGVNFMKKVLLFSLLLLILQNTAKAQSYEEELDKRLNLITKLAKDLGQRLLFENPNWICTQGTKTKYGRVMIEPTCALEKQAFGIQIIHYSSPDEAAKELKNDRDYSGYPEWHEVYNPGDHAIETDGCERAWLRFRKGQFFVVINGNVNDEAALKKPVDPKKLCGEGRDIVSEELLQTARHIANLLAEIMDAT